MRLISTLRLAILSSLLLLSLSIFASQENYVPGYFLSLNQDTVKGWIDFQDWEINPYRVYFKPSMEEEGTYFHPWEISGFGVWTDKEEHYRGVVMEIDQTPVKKSALLRSSDQILELKSIFLRIHVLGKVSLFSLLDEKFKKHLFIQAEGGEIEELQFNKYFVPQAKTKILVRNHRFRNQLRQRMMDCTQLHRGYFKNLSYSLESIKRVVLLYNECAAPNDISYVSDKDKVRFQLGTSTGVSHSQIRFRSPASPILQDLKHDLGPGYMAGIRVKMVLPRKRGTRSILAEFSYNSRSMQGERKHPEGQAFGVSTTDFQTQLIFQVQTAGWKVNPSFGAGFFASVTLDDSPLEMDPVNYAIKYVATDPFDLGFVAKAGIEFNRFSLDLRYLQHFNFASTTDPSGRPSFVEWNTQMIFGYYLTR